MLNKFIRYTKLCRFTSTSSFKRCKVMKRTIISLLNFNSYFIMSAHWLLNVGSVESTVLLNIYPSNKSKNKACPVRTITNKAKS